MKEEITPLQNAEVDNIKDEMEKFFLKIRAFRGEDLRKNAPFTFSGKADENYKMLDAYYDTLFGLKQEVDRLQELEELFELQIVHYPEIGDRKRLRCLKTRMGYEVFR